MPKQLHKNFTVAQVKSLLKGYLDKEIKIEHILSILGIKRSKFFELLNRYKKNPDNFSIKYNRKIINRKIDQTIEADITKELNTEKDLIEACTWLASNASRFVTGAIIPIDGGI